MTVIQLLQLLLVTTFVMTVLSEYKSVAQTEKKSTCGIRRLEGFDMMLTCYFHKNISSLQKGFTVYLYKEEHQWLNALVLCKWSPEVTCLEAPGYEYLYDIGVNHDHTNVRIVHAIAEHAGTYTCNLMGERNSGNCSLTEERNRRFTINGVYYRTVITSENSTVDMVCQSDTRTSIHIISEVDGNRLLARSPSDETLSGRLRYIINKTRCEDTGDYRCEFITTEGLYTETVRLLVHCRPRKKRDEGHTPFVAIRDNNSHLSFEMIAYPTPHLTDYYKLSLNEESKVRLRVQATCAAESAKPASVLCNITVINVTNVDDDAQFVVVFRNVLGELTFTFKIKLSGKKQIVPHPSFSVFTGWQSKFACLPLVRLLVPIVTPNLSLAG